MGRKWGNMIWMAGAAVAALILPSCAEISVDPVDEKDPVTYQAVVGTPTKAETAAQYDRGTPFMSAAYWNEDGGNSRSAATEYIAPSEVFHNGSFWSTAVEYFWPDQGSLTFLGYSPAGLSGVRMDRNGVSASWDSESTALKDVDFMVADVLTGQTNNGGNGVPMIFRHMLTRIRITGLIADLEDGETMTVSVTGLGLRSVNTTGDYSASMAEDDTWGAFTHSWTNQATTKTLGFISGTSTKSFSKTGDDEVPATDLSLYLAIPQEVTDDHELFVEYTIDSTLDKNDVADGKATKKLSYFHQDMDWERGREINYRLIFGPSIPITFDGSSDDWTDAPGGVME